MKPSNAPRPWRKVVATLAAGAVLTIALWNLFFGYSAFGQARRMRLASQHQPLLKKVLSSDPRFSQIVAGTTSAAEGCLLVTGQVASQKDLDDLRKAVSSTEPPVIVLYKIDVGSR